MSAVNVVSENSFDPYIADGTLSERPKIWVEKDPQGAPPGFTATLSMKHYVHGQALLARTCDTANNAVQLVIIGALQWCCQQGRKGSSIATYYVQGIW